MLLNEENFRRGFLIDEELMGGVSEDPARQGSFIAFVLRHTTGEYLGYQPFEQLQDALGALNGVQRNWAYEKSSGCGGCSNGSCGRGAEGCSVLKKTECQIRGGC